jgi:hypothetical protein
MVVDGRSGGSHCRFFRDAVHLAPYCSIAPRIRPRRVDRSSGCRQVEADGGRSSRSDRELIAARLFDWRDLGDCTLGDSAPVLFENSAHQGHQAAAC